MPGPDNTYREQGRSVPIASRAPASLTLLALLFGGKLAAADLFNDPSGVPEVLTATRLKQSPAEVPGSISVLDRELIVASGARDIPELMRLVPGMMVGYLSGNQPTVNYHGTSMSGARRLQVLIDGRSVYRPGLASVDWSDLPLALEDVERIEVFRGPNTVSYGANALMGVINIITRAPGESPGTRLKYTAGQRGIRDWYASQSIALEDSDFRLSLSGQEDDGFDRDHDGHALRDGRRLSRFNLNASHSLAPNQSLEWQLAAKEGSNQHPYAYRSPFPQVPDDIDNSDTLAHDYAGSLRWNVDLDPRHSFYIQGYAQHWERRQEWNACEAAIAFSPQLAQALGTEPGLPAQVRRRSDPAAARQRPGVATGDPGPRPATQWRTASGLRTGRPQHPGKPLRPGDAGHPQPGRQPAPAERPELPLRPGKLRDLLRRQGQQPDLAAVQPIGVACRRTLAAAGRGDARRRRGLRQFVQPAAGGELPVQPPAQPARGLFGGSAVTGHVRKRRRLALPGPPPDTGALWAERSLLLRQRPRPRRPGQGTHPFARDRLQRFFPRDRAGRGCTPVPRGNHRTDQRSAQRRRLQSGQRRSHPLLRRGRPGSTGAWAYATACAPPTPISTTTPPVATTGA